MTIWDNFKAENKKCYFKQIGPLKIWIEHRNDEWLVASKNVAGEYGIVHSEVLDSVPEDITWKRYVLPGNSKKVELSPAFSERSVIVRPESALKLVSGAQALFYVLIPLWVRISVGTQNKHTLTELPCQILSNTWFGEPHEGELCYYLKTTARRTLDNSVSRPHQAVCPVYIRNVSANDLDFSRLCIRTNFLSLYKGTSWLWTNKVHVQFRGINQTSKIRYDNEIPDFEPDTLPISKPRLKPVKEFSIKSFDTFKMFTGV